MPVNERTERILEAVIRRFISSGEPVSSGWLFDNYDFGIRPAMIRAELNDLEDAGYLEQPHHSAGRVPSDRAFEFFVRRVMGQGPAHAANHRIVEDFARDDWSDLLDRVSEELGALAAICTFPERRIYKEGLEALIDRLDWQSHDELRDVIRDVEHLDERVMRAREELTPEDPVRAFIGGKSPVTKSHNLAVMAGRYRADGEEVLLFAIGPKRMDYERAADLFRALIDQGLGTRD